MKEYDWDHPIYRIQVYWNKYYVSRGYFSIDTDRTVHWERFPEPFLSEPDARHFIKTMPKQGTIFEGYPSDLDLRNGTYSYFAKPE